MYMQMIAQDEIRTVAWYSMVITLVNSSESEKSAAISVAP